MIPAVFDANVIASGFLGSGAPPTPQIDRWLDGAVDLVSSDHILGEVAKTFQKPYFHDRYGADRSRQAIDILETQARLVVPDASVRGIASHPEDDLVLGTAVAGAVPFLVTGDRRLRRVGSYQNVVILGPAAFPTLLDALALDSPTGEDRP